MFSVRDRHQDKTLVADKDVQFERMLERVKPEWLCWIVGLRVGKMGQMGQMGLGRSESQYYFTIEQPKLQRKGTKRGWILCAFPLSASRWAGARQERGG